MSFIVVPVFLSIAPCYSARLTEKEEEEEEEEEEKEEEWDEEELVQSGVFAIFRLATKTF